MKTKQKYDIYIHYNKRIVLYYAFLVFFVMILFFWAIYNEIYQTHIGKQAFTTYRYSPRRKGKFFWEFKLLKSCVIWSNSLYTISLFTILLALLILLFTLLLITFVRALLQRGPVYIINLEGIIDFRYNRFFSWDQIKEITLDNARDLDIKTMHIMIESHKQPLKGWWGIYYGNRRISIISKFMYYEYRERPNTGSSKMKLPLEHSRKIHHFYDALDKK